jgi:N-formylmaleamate deformylase
MTNWRSGFCKANGVDIHYLRTGGDKPALVALHGLIGSGPCWTAVGRALEGDYDVVMPDARGHGKSSAPLRGYGFPAFTDDVVGLIKGLGLVRPVLLGHSMGGMTAAMVACRLGDAIRAVILADPTFISPDRQREVYEGDVLTQHRHLLKSTKGELLKELRLRHPHRSSEMLEHLADARLATQVSAFEVLKPPHPEYREVVTQIRVPVLLVAGDKGVVSTATAHELLTLNHQLQYEQIPDAGHGLPYDKPDRLAAAVQSFMRSADPA